MQWTPSSSNSQSLPKAGQWIGYIERMLILTFVFVGSFEGVGFLLAAKSVFRFGELNNAKEIRTTEYVLIGYTCKFLYRYSYRNSHNTLILVYNQSIK